MQALEWCIKEEMDVICMACGFHEHNKLLFDKIQEASAKMLIFAAATNESNAGEIAYPARYDSQVFCMFSTDGSVTSSRRINPSEGREKYNFAILGEDIRTHGGEQKSGTSFSTAIAAGFAGRLLDFARQSDSHGRIRGASNLRLKLGMSRVLPETTELDGTYRCIAPWKLLPRRLRVQIPFEGLPTDEEREEARRHICEIITKRLDDV